MFCGVLLSMYSSDINNLLLTFVMIHFDVFLLMGLRPEYICTHKTVCLFVCLYVCLYTCTVHGSIQMMSFGSMFRQD